jgi:hypothetical protein
VVPPLYSGVLLLPLLICRRRCDMYTVASCSLGFLQSAAGILYKQLRIVLVLDCDICTTALELDLYLLVEPQLQQLR